MAQTNFSITYLLSYAIQIVTIDMSEIMISCKIMYHWSHMKLSSDLIILSRDLSGRYEIIFNHIIVIFLHDKLWIPGGENLIFATVIH